MRNNFITALISSVIMGIFWMSDVQTREEKHSNQLKSRDKDILLYRTNYLKANTQVMDMKENCIYYARKK
jgi:hypothetical protein